ncbi:MAG: Pyruvate flavodoxin/ferredoxin oxidoreductase domain protein [Candidatus Roizmanbacteria bacterium GW2011_GWA2_37_7]|uniref:Pyruvate flavodoxin/ferredoxin oxidoreductase domain protein n=1 Tax=Candidatus Roizmanbacteria bacterium GW2011_GWA2_37_7 TaxID=1618481 RepID=A0A0G0KCH0_9BACT|nr:MAG: Pyruvate flavodoxin/ferredoxin oxidoreductase domain protein [Candidatus Roizmanbacteria bacterium GW2011_GWA2_37_7]
MKFNWKIGGEAGFGIMTSGLVFSKIATRSGYHIFDYAEYPSLIRGGHNTYEVVVSNDEITAQKWEIDLLVCLNKETFDLHKYRIHEKTIVIFDPEVFEFEYPCVKAPIGFTKIKKEEKIDQMMVNTIAVGASIAVLGGELSVFENIIHQQFDKKGAEVINFNLKLAKIGFEEAKKSTVQLDILKKKDVTQPKMVVTGNEAFSLATMGADCRYYAAYPMTPASSVLQILAAWQYKNKMVVRHPEDEISVINSALGASYAGARSAVGTSGGGFALMVEGISYAGIAEIPIVVFLSMRPGPATGMPTWTEQGDLLFATHAGHGEFQIIVLAPGDPEEMVDLTLKAFDLADIYQTAVIVVSDKFLSESHKSVMKEEIDKKLQNHTIDRGKITIDTRQSPYLRYKHEDDGISEMLIPGKKGVYYQANSYEHGEDSHTTENSEERIKQVDKRNTKTQTYFKNHFVQPKIFGELKEASIVIISWGANKGPIIEAQKMLTNQKTAYIHFTHVYPIPQEPIKQLFSRCDGKRMILVENNSHGQFGQLLRMQTGIEIKEKLLKYDGRPIWPEEIRNYITGGSSSKKTHERFNGIKSKVQDDINTNERIKVNKENIKTQQEEDILYKLEKFAAVTNN